MLLLSQVWQGITSCIAQRSRCCPWRCAICAEWLFCSDGLSLGKPWKQLAAQTLTISCLCNMLNSWSSSWTRRRLSGTERQLPQELFVADKIWKRQRRVEPQPCGSILIFWNAALITLPVFGDSMKEESSEKTICLPIYWLYNWTTWRTWRGRWDQRRPRTGSGQQAKSPWQRSASTCLSGAMVAAIENIGITSVRLWTTTLRSQWHVCSSPQQTEESFTIPFILLQLICLRWPPSNLVGSKPPVYSASPKFISSFCGYSRACCPSGTICSRIFIVLLPQSLRYGQTLEPTSEATNFYGTWLSWHAAGLRVQASTFSLNIMEKDIVMGLLAFRGIGYRSLHVRRTLSVSLICTLQLKLVLLELCLWTLLHLVQPTMWNLSSQVQRHTSSS